MKKSKTVLLLLTLIFLFCIVALIVVVVSCDFEDVNDTNPPTAEKPAPVSNATADTTGTVAPDGILETVTWNLEWYGSVGNGPDDEGLQTHNIIKAMDSLKADLYAVEEVRGEQAMRELTTRMKGYHGFVAKDQPRTQKTGFIFNTRAIDSVSSGLITDHQDYHSWASGRYPFYFSFNYKYNNLSIPVYAVVIHAKASDDQDSYQRRKNAARQLYHYLTANKPDANLIFLGDYNDDVDESIYNRAETPYEPFLNDREHYLVITKSLSDRRRSSTAYYSDTIDHITVSNEMEKYYILGSEKVSSGFRNYIKNYANTTTDHFPVWTTFDMTR